MRVYFLEDSIQNPWGTRIKTINEIKSSNELTFLITNEKIEAQNEIKQIIIDKNLSINENLDEICKQIREYESVHTFGDSHSIITHKVNICRENWLGFNTSYPLTMNRFGLEGLNLHECIKVMGNGHENFPIRENDWAMYYYGEIDVRYLILRQVEGLENLETNYPGETEEMWMKKIKHKRPLSDVIDTLIYNYIDQIKKNEQTFKCKSLISYLAPPARNIQPPNLYTGSFEQRMELYDIFTKKLYHNCELNGIKVVSVYDKIINEDKSANFDFIKKEGDIHLNMEYYFLIRDAIMKIIITN